MKERPTALTIPISDLITSLFANACYGIEDSNAKARIARQRRSRVMRRRNASSRQLKEAERLGIDATGKSATELERDIKTTRKGIVSINQESDIALEVFVRNTNEKMLIRNWIMRHTKDGTERKRLMSRARILKPELFSQRRRRPK